MKIAIVFYSFTGHTEKIAANVRLKLNTRHDVEFFKLKVENEETNFFKQCQAAFMQTAVTLKDAPTDFSMYDLIFVGSPVWAFKPAPAIKAFLNKAAGFTDKKAVLFFTYGSGTGVNNCVKFTGGLLAQKGAMVMKTFTFPQAKIEDDLKIDKELTFFLKDISG